MIGSQLLRENFTRESLEEGVHYLLLTAIQNLEEEVDLELLRQTKPTPGWHIGMVKRRHAVPTLLSLALLCQAALLAFDPDDVHDDAANLLGGRETMRTIRVASPSSSGERMLTRQAWHGALGSTGDAVGKAIANEWPLEGSCEGLRNLINLLYDGVAPLDVATLSRAYGELYQALEGKQETQC